MKNITLNIIGQRILADILSEKKDIIQMNVLFFENINDYLTKTKKNSAYDIIITHLSNFQLIEQSDQKIINHVFYLTNKKNSTKVKTKFQKYELIYCPLNFKNFIDKMNITYVKYQFADNSKICLSNYTINLNTKEIYNDNKKLKLTEREKDFLLFLKDSDRPQTIKKILESVWGYSKDIETHTVETHVHRLRKKFLNSFNDTNFIKNNKMGYYI